MKQNSEIDIQQITTFADDVTIDSYTKPMLTVDEDWTKMAEDGPTHDVLAVLQRPVVVHTGEFNTAFASLTLKFPDIIFSNSENVINKLNYFAYFRANVRIRLIFNATPFMSGRYWMFFAPFDSVSNRKAHVTPTLILQNCTGYPGVEIDLASNAPVEIEIPYCAPLSHYNLINAFSNMGELYLVPLNSIQTGTAPVGTGAGASFSILAWFTNIDLAMPTSAKTAVPTILRAQIGGSDEECTSSITVSQVADQVATTASRVSDVPVLGSIAKPVSWVSKAVAGVASTFGWNKPDSLAPNSSFYNLPAKGYTNASGIDSSVKLGAMPDNSLPTSSGLFSTDVDEMDISHISKKSCIYASNVDWTLVQSPGTKLHTVPVAPGICGGNARTFYPTTLAYLASLFKYWRGGLKFRMTVAKTAFHTGRLRITYHAAISDITTAVTPQNAYNWILDLSTSSELEFTIPYVANVPWKEVKVAEYNQPDFVPESTKPGFITVEVLTSLRRASDSVSDNCPLNFWISADTDFSLAIPDGGDYAVTIPISRLDDDVILEAQIFNRTDPSISHNEQVDFNSQQFFPASRMSYTKPEQLSIGEKFTSLRQLIKRFCPIAYAYPFPYLSPDRSKMASAGPIPMTVDNYLFNQIELDPAYFGRIDDNIGYQDVVYPTYGSLENDALRAMARIRSSHPLYRISYLFRFYRGGIRYKIINPPTNDLNFTTSGQRVPSSASNVYAYDVAIDSTHLGGVRPQLPMFAVRGNDIVENDTLEEPRVTSFTKFDNFNQFEHCTYPDLNGILEVEVPYYSQLPISVVGENTLGTDDGPLVRRSKIKLRRSHDPYGMDIHTYDYVESKTFPTTGEESYTGGIRNCIGGAIIYQAAADDFSFGYLIGAPPISKLSF
jgi:hypothetical protein